MLSFNKDTFAIKIQEKLLQLFSHFFSFLILLTIVVLTLFSGYKVYDLFLSLFTFQFEHIVHDIAYIIVLIKAYRVLLHYFQKHHISIKYILEISIIAPAIEIIFASNNHELGLTIFLGIYSIANLIIYFVFYNKLNSK